MSSSDDLSLDIFNLSQPLRQGRYAHPVSNFQVAEPVSWKMLETRATSFPYTRLASQTNLPKENYQSGNMGGIRTWTSTVQNRQTSGMNQFVASSPTHSPIPTRLRKRGTPVLTLALLKLDENLSEFCRFLEDPTYDHVQKACGIFDSSMATASSGSAKNPCNGTKSPERPPPSLSPISMWFSGGTISTDPSPTSSAVALEGEWEMLCNPLIVFACLEGIYASLSHAESSELAWSLSKHYEKTTSDLVVVRETLCDPFLSPPNHGLLSADGVSSPNLSLYREKAAVVAISLDSIVNVCQCRRKLIWQQRELWSCTDTVNLSEASAVYQSLLPLAKAMECVHHATTIVANVQKEVTTWYHLTEMALSLEQLRYVSCL
jgi:hypothetical protein